VHNFFMKTGHISTIYLINSMFKQSYPLYVDNFAQIVDKFLIVCK